MTDSPSSTAPAAGAPNRPRSLRVTVLFADITGFTALSDRIGAERAYFAVTGLLGLLDEIARRYGGSVDKYMGDAMLVLFGHPVPTPSSERAALAAAIEMRDRARSYRTEVADAEALDVVVGVNTGDVVVGDLAGSAIREFHVLGDAVNMAARIKAKTSVGRVHAGAATVRAAGEHFETVSLGAFAVKGKTEPIEIFDVRSARSDGLDWLGAGHRQALQIVGRESELERIRAAVDAASRADSGLRLLLSGPGGIGKRSLLREISRLAHEAGHRVERLDGRAATLEADVVRVLSGPRPLTLLVEGIDRAGSAWLGALPEPENAKDLLVVATARQTAQLPEHFEAMPLAPLDDETARRFVASLDLRTPLDDEMLALVLERGAGIPDRLAFAAHAAPALQTRLQDVAQVGDRDQGERRRATILFADITGFTALTARIGAERAYPVVARALTLLDSVARRHGGTVEKYLGDCVMALFGIPEALEDAPQAAVNAAIEMRRRLRDFARSTPDAQDLDVHTGIHTGLGIAGDISGPLLREFAIMGDPVTIADGLKDVAPSGTIYIGDESHRFLSDAFECRLVGELELPRVARPVPSFEVLTEREHLGRERAGHERRVTTPLVGRDRELAALTRAVEGLRRGRGGLVSLVAEPGLGKSRLLAELAATPEAGEVGWLEGVSLAMGRRTGLHTIADLLRRAAGIDEDDGDDDAWKKIEALATPLLGATTPDSLPYLGVVLGLELSDADRERLESIEIDALEKLVQGSLASLVTAAAKNRPQVIVMDDLHWADVSSISMLESLFRLAEEQAVLFVLVFRPGYETTSGHLLEVARQQFADRHLELRLSPLDPGAARALLHALFQPEDLPYQTRRTIEERSGGNPFYIEEVVRALVDQGAVEVVDGRFRATEKITAFEVPGSVQDVITVRIDALPRGARRVLQAASVVGQRFHRSVLAEIVEGREIDAQVARLIDAEFLIRSERMPADELEFKHPLLQEVTYEGLLETHRVDLHRRVGLAIEARLPETVPGYLGMLAYHFSKGRDLARAESFLFRAGDEAARAAAPSEALDFFEEASRLYMEMNGDDVDPEKLALLERKIADALYYRGRFPEAIDHYNRALARLGDRVDWTPLATAVQLVKDAVSILAHLYLPASLLPAPRPTTPRERTVMELRYARAEATVTAEPTRHVLNGLETLARLQRYEASSVPRSGKMYAGAAALFAYGGISFGVSRRLSKVAERIVASQDQADRLYEQVMRYAARTLEGDWAPEHEVDPELLARILDLGQPWSPVTYLGFVGEKAIRTGDLATGRACIEQEREIWDRYRYDLAKANFYYLRMLLLLEERELEDAIAAARQYHDENPEDLLNLLALSGRAKAEVLLGQLDVASETLERAAALAEACAPLPPWHAASFRAAQLRRDIECIRQARIAGDRHALREARRAAERSVRAARSAARTVAWWRPEVVRRSASAAFEGGSPRTGWRRLEQSRETSRALGIETEYQRAQLLAVYVQVDGIGGAAPAWARAETLRSETTAALRALGLHAEAARLED